MGLDGNSIVDMTNTFAHYFDPNMPDISNDPEPEPEEKDPPVPDGTHSSTGEPGLERPVPEPGLERPDEPMPDVPTTRYKHRGSVTEYKQIDKRQKLYEYLFVTLVGALFIKLVSGN